MRLGEIEERVTIGEYVKPENLQATESSNYVHVLRCNNEGTRFFLVYGSFAGDYIEEYEPGEFELILTKWTHVNLDRMKWTEKQFSEFIRKCDSLLDICRPLEKRRVDDWDLP